MLNSSSTIIFDLGGVYFTDGTGKAITTISNRYSIDIGTVTEIFHGDVGTAYRENKISEKDFWEIAKKKWEIENVAIDELSTIWLDGYTPIEEVVKIILQLKESGFELLYFSGSTKERIEYLEKKYSFMQYFKDGIFSFEIGVRKPSILPYQCILQKASNHPHNCLYIDDKEKYITPAKELGMNTMLFTNYYCLYTDLKALGLVYKGVL
jgi:HAD superfamily hydrolase (TIGR01509 family)